MIVEGRRDRRKNGERDWSRCIIIGLIAEEQTTIASGVPEESLALIKFYHATRLELLVRVIFQLRVISDPDRCLPVGEACSIECRILLDARAKFEIRQIRVTR